MSLFCDWMDKVFWPQPPTPDLTKAKEFHLFCRAVGHDGKAIKGVDYISFTRDEFFAFLGVIKLRHKAVKR